MVKIIKKVKFLTPTTSSTHKNIKNNYGTLYFITRHDGYGDSSRIESAELGELARHAIEVKPKHDRRNDYRVQFG